MLSEEACWLIKQLARSTWISPSIPQHLLNLTDCDITHNNFSFQHSCPDRHQVLSVVEMDGSCAILVIQTHQQSSLEIFIRFSGDFLMGDHSSAIPESSRVQKSPLRRMFSWINV